jgi:hypothetical protein
MDDDENDATVGVGDGVCGIELTGRVYENGGGSSGCGVGIETEAGECWRRNLEKGGVETVVGEDLRCKMNSFYIRNG